MGNRRIDIACLTLVSTGLWVGCGGNSAGRYAISGAVKADGAPLEKGNISFQPLEGARTSSGAVISGGNFMIPGDKGLPVGKYRVAINAAAPGGSGRAAVANVPPGEAPPPPKELIPAEWNESSTHTIEVKKEGPFIFPFEITTKGR
jgi:hypothetical protein